MSLDRKDLVDALTELGRRARDSGKIIDIAVYGGSCLMLVSNFRDASQDVDAVASTDQAFIDRTVAEIGAERNWPTDWFNDYVRVYLSPNIDMPDGHEFFGSYPSERSPGLRVYVPTPEYMLAMKLMALRIDDAQGSKDRSDIENLISIVGIDSKAALIGLAARYYPEAKVSAKLILAADKIVEDSVHRKSPHEAPRYLERGDRRPRNR